MKKKEEEEEGKRGKSLNTRQKLLDSGLLEKKGQYSSLSPCSYYGTSGTFAIKSG